MKKRKLAERLEQPVKYEDVNKSSKSRRQPMSLKQKPKIVNVSRDNIVSWIAAGLTSFNAFPRDYYIKDIDIYGLLTDIQTGQKIIDQKNFNLRLTLEKQEANTIINGEVTT